MIYDTILNCIIRIYQYNIRIYVYIRIYTYIYVYCIYKYVNIRIYHTNICMSRPGSVVSYLPVSVMICSLFAQSARASDYGWEPWLLGGRVDDTGSREIGINLQGR